MISSADIGEKVTIVGGNVQAVDVALYLIAQGKHVTIVSPDQKKNLPKVSHGLEHLPFLCFMLVEPVWPNAKITAVKNKRLQFLLRPELR